MNAAPLNTPKTMYIFQLMLRRSGGTANESAQFHAQLDAVERATAMARTLCGNTSEGIAHETGPQVVAKVATTV